MPLLKETTYELSKEEILDIVATHLKGHLEEVLAEHVGAPSNKVAINFGSKEVRLNDAGEPVEQFVSIEFKVNH